MWRYVKFLHIWQKFTFFCLYCVEKAEIPLHVEKFEISPHLPCIEFELSLGGHLKTHSVEKLNKCNQCDYASTQANTLRAHVNTHSGEKSNKLQPMYVCILLYQCFEDTFEKTQWRKAI